MRLSGDLGIARRDAGWVQLAGVDDSAPRGRGHLITWDEARAGETVAPRARVEHFAATGAPLEAGERVLVKWERASEVQPATVRALLPDGATVELDWLANPLPSPVQEAGGT